VFRTWQSVPPPQRGEIVRQIGQALREHKSDLGLLVTLEAGKIRSEGLGEVQEMIDMADFAVGLSRQLYGLTIATERANHRMLEQWHPLGPVGVITAFNFPVAVWAWNAMIAAVCGDTCLWKPSELTPLTAIAVQNIVNRVLEPQGLAGSSILLRASLVSGCSERLPLISATGSTRWAGHATVAQHGVAIGTRRQQRPDPHRIGRSGPRAASRAFCRRRHGRATLHDAPAADRARVDR
jgi:aldehyde dehydrogenase (NAD+)